jgi:DNA (cytosine-5)-methyltransferase 1
MRHISLFSGIGGFDLAAEWMGWQNVAHCEINPFGQKVLKYYWPESEMIEDVHDIDKFKKYAGTIDIISGGFPCQPYSQAGKRLGKEDDRHLWPQMLRIIREVQPKWVVGENVLGLTNWNGGMVFDEVQADLEAEGYEVQAYVLPACGVNAPHRRDRVWFVGRRYAADPESDRREWQGAGIAFEEGLQPGPEPTWKLEGRFKRPCSNGTTPDPDCNGQHGCNCKHEINTGEGRQYAQRDIKPGNDNGTTPDPDKLDGNISGFRSSETSQFQTSGILENNVADTINEGLQGGKFNGTPDTKRQERRQQPSRPATQFYQITYWRNFPTQSPVCERNDGLSSRLSGITFPKWRNESIKAMGNAIVPQVVYQIFKAIGEYEK